MTATKKVRVGAKNTTKAEKKNVGSGKTSVSKTRSTIKGTATKSLSTPKLSRAIKKSDKVGNKKQSSPKTTVSAKVKETIRRTTKDKRKKRELSGAEYDAFVTKSAKKSQVPPEKLVTVDRRSIKPIITEKLIAEPVVKSEEIKERRQKVQRRRQIDPTTCERDYSQDEIEFMNALDEYKRNSGRMFPTCSEVLEVFRGLGYQRQSHDESIDISVDPDSGEVYFTTSETGTMSRDDDPFDKEHASDISMT